MINIALIPARSGSKRLKNKNIIDFFGKPMIYWPINSLKKSKIFDSIYVSTDSVKIKNIAIQYGAKSPFLRPKKISDDNAKTIDVMKHFVRYLISNKIKFDNICCVYPTSVFLDSKNIIKGYKQLIINKNDLVFTATKVDPRIQRSFYYDHSLDKLKILFPKNMHTRTQDLSTIFVDAAQYYWGNKKFWINCKQILSTNSSFIELESKSIVDIDTVGDYKKALTKFKLHIKH